ncbi:SDR family NAD(P)-dependent oxidoreductase [Bradyrhizobium sp. WD16]|uniref:SDR family NAD(P)-dependent oxidoreductase n=1 Tax=Bradyrhizobium sp. WD16 TaxID=1521768 RepID=UPI0020A54287|nr:SDR family NAD(P)-dependent oxidoreductase [Bradyrhizobium sp. WD16]UTD27349.1 oxidoreductase [Bradyrhizobium sp. WD16]
MTTQTLRVIVTGAASGLGAATARGLACPGAKLVLNYGSNADGAEEVAAACRSAGAEVAVVQGDVSIDANCRRIAEAANGWGGLDALVNNAGITRHVEHSQLEGLEATDFQRIFAVNTIGPYQMVRAARALLEAGARERGRASAVVNVSSIAGLSGVGSSIAYVASKGALNAMTLSLARALAPAVRVNAVCPGYIDTEWFVKGRGAEAAGKVREMVEARVPLRVASSAEDVAGVVCFMAGPQSGHMTGELVRIDAGMHLG